MICSNEQLEQWHYREQPYLADTASVKAHKEIYQRRLHVQQEMLLLLDSFFDGAITLKEFNRVFQQRTHDTWNVFHLRGMSGGLFLNKLVKYIPEEDTFAHLLRMLLRVPVDQQDGERHMKAFTRFLEGIIASGQATRLQLQPARVPFFLSVWWHIQEVEHWPIFYLELRHVLLSEEGIENTLQDPVERYFVFKTRFLALQQTLGLTAWEVEQLIRWYHTKSTPDRVARSLASTSCGSPCSSRQLTDMSNDTHSETASMPTSTISRRENVMYKKGQENTHQTHIQWVLAKLGLKIGYSVWIATNDHEKVCHEEKLGDLSLPSLPLLMDSAFQPIIEHIDILWLRKNEVIAAYEVAPTAKDVSQCLLRLSDLAVLFPKRDVQFCVVTPQGCFEHVQYELAHPIFQHHDMHKRSHIIIQEYLVQHAEHILRWANSPSVMHDLTIHLSMR